MQHEFLSLNPRIKNRALITRHTFKRKRESVAETRCCYSPRWILKSFLSETFHAIKVAPPGCVRLRAWRPAHPSASFHCGSAGCGAVHLTSTWSVLLYWQAARRELGRMNPLIPELLNVFAVWFADFFFFFFSTRGVVNVRRFFLGALEEAE